MITCGIDPSRGNLAVSFVKDRDEIDYFEVENDGQGHLKILKKLKGYLPLPGVCIEGHGDFAKRFALFCNSNNIELYEINPLKAKKLKESITWDKSDHIDAFISALMPFNNKHLSEMRVSLKGEGLNKLSRGYETISKDAAAYQNIFHAYLNQNYGPVYKKFFKRASMACLNFFIEYSTPQKLAKASVSEIHETLKLSGSKFYCGKNGLKKSQDIKRIIEKECPMEHEYFTAATGSMICATANIITQLLVQKKAMREEIGRYIAKHYPGYLEAFKEKFSSFGIIHLSQILGETGSILKFETHGNLASYGGQASRNMQSAKQSKKVRRQGYNRHLAKAIHNVALNNCKKGCCFYDYYEDRKKRFARKLRALKSVKRVVCKIIFETMQQLEAKEKININAA